LLAVAPLSAGISPAWFASLPPAESSLESIDSTPAATGPGDNAVQPDGAEWIVQLTEAEAAGFTSVSEAAGLFANSGLSVVSGLGKTGQVLVRAAAAAGSAEQWLANHPAVAYFEPNFAAALAAVPNDPSFSLLWGLHNTGQSGGTEELPTPTLTLPKPGTWWRAALTSWWA
jgi:hypothetical protein